MSDGTISAIAIHNPKRIYWCDNCLVRIVGRHLRCYGTCHVGCKPWTIRLCVACAGKSKDVKIQRAFSMLSAASAVPNGPAASTENGA